MLLNKRLDKWIIKKNKWANKNTHVCLRSTKHKGIWIDGFKKMCIHIIGPREMVQCSFQKMSVDVKPFLCYSFLCFGGNWQKAEEKKKTKKWRCNRNNKASPGYAGIETYRLLLLLLLLRQLLHIFLVCLQVNRTQRSPNAGGSESKRGRVTRQHPKWRRDACHPVPTPRLVLSSTIAEDKALRVLPHQTFQEALESHTNTTAWLVVCRCLVVKDVLILPVTVWMVPRRASGKKNLFVRWALMFLLFPILPFSSLLYPFWLVLHPAFPLLVFLPFIVIVLLPFS